MSTSATPSPHVIDATVANFEAEILQASLKTPVLLDFHAEWCGPCKTLGPTLEKLAGEYNGAFVLAKVDVDAEQQLAAAFQIRSVPTVILVTGGQPVDGFPGAVTEGELRQFLARHGIEPAAPALEGIAPGPDQAGTAAAPVDPHAEAARLRAQVQAEPDKDEHRLDLALALLGTGELDEARQLLDALPANLATDDRTVKAHAWLGFAKGIETAPPLAALETAVAANPDDPEARHLLGTRLLLDGQHEAALEQWLELLRRNRDYNDGQPRRALIDAFRVIDDATLVGQYRRKMSALLF